MKAISVPSISESMTLELGSALCTLRQQAGEFRSGPQLVIRGPVHFRSTEKVWNEERRGAAFSEKGRRRRGGVVPCSFEFRSRLFLGRRCGLSLTKTIKFRPVRPTQSVRSLSKNCQLNPKDSSANAILRPLFHLPMEMRK